ncbi:hypothetical protein AB9B82_09960, partial [Escherichia coli]
FVKIPGRAVIGFFSGGASPVRFFPVFFIVKKILIAILKPPRLGGAVLYGNQTLCSKRRSAPY